jgi:hypothetical protein
MTTLDTQALPTKFGNIAPPIRSYATGTIGSTQRASGLGKFLPNQQRTRAEGITFFKAILLHGSKTIFCGAGEPWRRLPAVGETATNDREWPDETCPGDGDQ